MDESQILVGRVYWAEFAGRLLRAKVLGSLPLCPNWWDCLELESGAVQSLPTSAFVGLDAAQELVDPSTG